jgi:hypothetical protein
LESHPEPRDYDWKKDYGEKGKATWESGLEEEE